MLILEGSDCLGKTTFAKLLLKEADGRERFPTFYSHMSRPNKSFNFWTHYKDMMTIYAVQDRFHLGGIVWHQAIWQGRLEIIEGWLRSIGSMIIVFYASDEQWYRDMIEKDERGNLLPVEEMCRANSNYAGLALVLRDEKPIVDFSFDIKSPNNMARFPDSYIAGQIVSEWFARLRLLEAI